MDDSIWGRDFTFVPSDQQIVQLLKERLSSYPAPAQLSGIAIATIRDVNVYGDLNPEEIFNQSGPVHQKERFCFTPLKRKTQGGQRFARTTGGGTWKLQSKVHIHDNVTNQPIGVKNYFSYQAAKDAPRNLRECSWGMYEFSLISPCQSHGDYAIRKIKKTRKSRKCEREENISACAHVPIKTRCTESISIIENTAPTFDNIDQSQLSDWMEELFGSDNDNNLGFSMEELFGTNLSGITMGEEGCSSSYLVDSNVKISTVQTTVNDNITDLMDSLLGVTHSLTSNNPSPSMSIGKKYLENSLAMHIS